MVDFKDSAWVKVDLIEVFIEKYPWNILKVEQIDEYFKNTFELFEFKNEFCQKLI